MLSRQRLIGQRCPGHTLADHAEEPHWECGCCTRTHLFHHRPPPEHDGQSSESMSALRFLLRLPAPLPSVFLDRLLLPWSAIFMYLRNPRSMSLTHESQRDERLPPRYLFAICLADSPSARLRPDADVSAGTDGAADEAAEATAAANVPNARRPIGASSRHRAALSSMSTRLVSVWCMRRGEGERERWSTTWTLSA
jgi:hypothetical protein